MPPRNPRRTKNQQPRTLRSPTVRQQLAKAVPVPKDPARMNKSEARFSRLLDAMQQQGRIREWRFQAFRLRLADNTTYTPDFRVITAEGLVIFIEFKGSWTAPNQDDSRVKLKVAAEEFTDCRWMAFELKTRRTEWFGPHGADESFVISH